MCSGSSVYLSIKISFIFLWITSIDFRVINKILSILLSANASSKIDFPTIPVDPVMMMFFMGFLLVKSSTLSFSNLYIYSGFMYTKKASLIECLKFIWCLFKKLFQLDTSNFGKQFLKIRIVLDQTIVSFFTKVIFISCDDFVCSRIVSFHD